LHSCFELQFNDFDFESKIYIDVSSLIGKAITIITEHDPAEFEADSHYLRTPAGDDVEPVHSTKEPLEASPPHFEKASYWTVLSACLVVNIMTLVGVALVGMGSLRTSTTMQCGLSGFASGALLAVAAFLMLIESFHLTSEGWPEDETDSTWRWGMCLLAGFIAPLVGHLACDAVGLQPVACLKGTGPLITSSNHMHAHSVPKVTSVAIVSGAKRLELTAQSNSTTHEVSLDDSLECGPPPVSSLGDSRNGENSSIQKIDVHDDDASTSVLATTSVIATILGDFLHNFTDGVLIGSAFKLCSPTLGWAIVWASVAHEVAQELADFIVLTSPPLALPAGRALALNFAVGLSVVAGGLVVTAFEVSSPALGLILAFGAGTYIHLGAVISLPKALANMAPLLKDDKESRAHNWKHVTLVLGSFAVGAIAIGLILIDHKHCEAQSSDSLAMSGASESGHASH
jgi:UTP--glucose-1-phosphate uridylyltransferase